jgi:serine protease Do
LAFLLRSARIIGVNVMRGQAHGRPSLLFALVLGTALATLPPGSIRGHAAAASAPPTGAREGLPSLAPLVARVAPAVVDVSAVEMPRLASHRAGLAGSSFHRGSVEELLRHFFDDRDAATGERVVALGSGFIVDPSGYIVTSSELAARGDRLDVTLPDHSSYPARIVGRDDTTDLALIKIETHQKLPYLVWGDSDSAAAGDWVIAIGNSFGLGGTVTAGIISAVGRSLGDGSYDDLMQIDAPINRGDSGGPTFDLSGRVIGVNTALYSPSGGSAGIGFAVPANIARKVVAQLRTHGHATWGWLGVSLKSLTPSLARRFGLDPDGLQGALVASVIPNGPAARAGLRPGDVIMAAAGRPIADARDLPRLVERTPVGSRLALVIRRRGRKRTIAARIAERPADSEAPAPRAKPPKIAPPPDLGVRRERAGRGGGAARPGDGG